MGLRSGLGELQALWVIRSSAFDPLDMAAARSHDNESVERGFIYGTQVQLV